MTELEKLKVQTGESDETLLSLLLENSTEYVLAYTGRSHMIPALNQPVRELAVIALNRMGTEGESGRSGAGESYTFDNAPKRIFDVLNRYRLARIGGKRFEAKEKPACDVPSPPSHTKEG